MDHAGIYVHIPFCLKKCNYCDFYSEAIDDREIRKAYTKALFKEIGFYGTKYGKNFVADTIFFGGGTPTLMEPEFIDKIIQTLRTYFKITEQCEITMECNPATVTKEKLEKYRQAGVNRLSIGAQSFDDDVLQALGRVHKACDIQETFSMARDAGFENISLDLMFAVPKQTMKSWTDTIKKALELQPEHISLYSLEVVPGTVFGQMEEEGTLKVTSEEKDRKMYKRAIEMLIGAGFNHYEISNTSKPLLECRHNMKYWSLAEYLGLGAGAHSYIKGVRYYNISDISSYFTVMLSQDTESTLRLGGEEVFGADCVDQYVVNSYQDNVSEYTFTALRTKMGVDFNYFNRRFKMEFWDIYGEQRLEFEKYVRDGYAISDYRHIALTPKGMDISNKIMALFV